MRTFTVVALLALASAAHAATSYTATEIAGPADISALPFAINNHGQILIGVQTAPGVYGIALYDPDGTRHDIPNPPGAISTFSGRLNDAGQIAAVALLPSSSSCAFLQVDGQWVPLTQDHLTLTSIYGLGGSGNLVSGYATAEYPRAAGGNALWNNGTLQITGAWIRDINNANTLLMYGNDHWLRSVTGDTHLPPVPGFQVIDYAVLSDNDLVAVTAMNRINVPLQFGTFLYDHGTYTPIPTTTDAGFPLESMIVSGINNAGIVVGTCNWGPFIYDEGTTFLLADRILNPESILWLRSPSAINNDGSILVSGYNIHGRDTTFLLTPTDIPEPHAFLLLLASLGAAAASLCLRRRRPAPLR